VLIDKNGAGVVPYLPLPELRSGQASPLPPRSVTPPVVGATR
jgi:modulator of FtsH protease HflK